MTRQLPRFSMYAQQTTIKPRPTSYVSFKVNERIQRICMWINQNFLMPEDLEVTNEPELRFNLKCLRDNSNLAMVFEISGKAYIYTENLSLASDLVQSLAKSLNLDCLEVAIIKVFESYLMI